MRVNNYPGISTCPPIKFQSSMHSARKKPILNSEYSIILRLKRKMLRLPLKQPNLASFDMIARNSISLGHQIDVRLRWYMMSYQSDDLVSVFLKAKPSLWLKTPPSQMIAFQMIAFKTCILIQVKSRKLRNAMKISNHKLKEGVKENEK